MGGGEVTSAKQSISLSINFYLHLVTFWLGFTIIIHTLTHVTNLYMSHRSIYIQTDIYIWTNKLKLSLSYSVSAWPDILARKHANLKLHLTTDLLKKKVYNTRMVWCTCIVFLKNNVQQVRTLSGIESVLWSDAVILPSLVYCSCCKRWEHAPCATQIFIYYYIAPNFFTKVSALNRCPLCPLATRSLPANHDCRFVIFYEPGEEKGCFYCHNIGFTKYRLSISER